MSQHRSPAITSLKECRILTASIDHQDRPYGSGRATTQRLLIASAAAARPGSFSVDALAADVSALDATVGAATVYRAVAAMLASGWIERVGEHNGSALFARCTQGGHHHHVVCDRCGRVAAAECPLAGNTSPTSADSGFVITRHEVTLYGLCPECAHSARPEA